jgi:hypothetical protein
MTTSPSPAHLQMQGPLADVLVALAQTPGGMSGIDAELARIAQLAHHWPHRVPQRERNAVAPDSRSMAGSDTPTQNLC